MASHGHTPGCARLNVMRLNAARLNAYEPVIMGSVNGVARGHNLRIEGAGIEQILNDQVDTAQFRASGFTPVAGQVITVYDGDAQAEMQIFGGRIIETTRLYEDRKENEAFDLQCVDPTWLLGRRLVLATYVALQAGDIVFYIINTFTRGVTMNHVTIPRGPEYLIDRISFTNESVPVALTAVAERVGANWYLDYTGDLHFFINESPDAYAITDASPRGASDLRLSEDLSQVVTRVVGRGGGVGAAVDVAVGSTEIPVEEGDTSQWYSMTGGIVEAETQRLTYSGMRGMGGVGALVGTGNAPTNKPVIWQASNYGSALTAATYQYAITFLTAAGESLPGPRATETVSNAMPPVPVQPTFREGTYGPWSGDINQPVIGGWYQLRLVFPFDGGSYGISPASAPIVWNGKYWQLYTGPTAMDPLGRGFTYYPALHPPGYVPPSRYRQVWIDRTSPANNYANFYGAGHIDVPTSVYWNDWYTLSYVWSDSDTINGAGGQHPKTQGPPFGALYLAQLPTSSHPDITGRKLYRTAANGSQLRLLETLNKTQSEYLDIKGDGTLGANAPTADTSNIKETEGQVLQGATILPVSSISPFEADGGANGGWVRIGGMAVRYTGLDLTGGKLTGIPATGMGSITAIVKYGAQVLVQPRLVGVPATGEGSITLGVRKGDTLTIRLEQEDVNAAAAMATRLQPPGGPVNYYDGIIELPVSDSRFTLTELQDHMTATLQDRKDPRQTVTFLSRDLSLQVGRLITIQTTKPAINGTFRIQKISLTEIAISGGRATVHPLKRVEASNKLYKFTDLLRRLRSAEGGVR